MLRSKVLLNKTVRVVLKNFDRKGGTTVLDAQAGQTVLQACWNAKLDCLEGACDHAMACSTCQVYVAEKDLKRLTPPTEEELDMLDLAFQPKPESRLACQIMLTPSLDSIEFEVPGGVSNRLYD